MNEDIRKNEISEEQLENVSGGFVAQNNCPKCGGVMIAHASFVNGAPNLEYFACGKCGYRE